MTMLWSIENKARLQYCLLLLCINLFRILWRPSNSNECRFGCHCRWWASNCCHYREARKKSFFFVLLILPKSFDDGLAQPPLQRLPGVLLVYQNHAAEGEKGSSWWGCLWAVCLASQKPSEWKCFIPARTDWSVKLLSCWHKYLFSPGQGEAMRNPKILSMMKAL